MKVALAVICLVSPIDGFSIETEGIAEKITSKGTTYLNGFLDMLYPLPESIVHSDADNEMFLSAAINDPKMAYLLWQGAMETAESIFKNAKSKNLIPESMGLLEKASHEEALGNSEEAFKLRENVSKNLLSVVNIMGNLMHKNISNSSINQAARDGYELLNGIPEKAAQESAELLEQMTRMTHEPSARLQEIRRKRKKVQRDLQHFSDLHSKLLELDSNVDKNQDDTSELRNILEEITKSIQDYYLNNHKYVKTSEEKSEKKPDNVLREIDSTNNIAQAEQKIKSIITA